MHPRCGTDPAQERIDFVSYLSRFRVGRFERFVSVEKERVLADVADQLPTVQGNHIAHLVAVVPYRAIIAVVQLEKELVESLLTNRFIGRLKSIIIVLRHAGSYYRSTMSVPATAAMMTAATTRVTPSSRASPTAHTLDDSRPPTRSDDGSE